MNDSLERVDIVDQNNCVLYQVSKKEAHKKGLLHRTVIAELITAKGEWILVKQASDRQDAGQYVSPVGGHVRAGESEEDALKREAKEEIGIKDFEYKFIARGIYNRFVRDKQENHYFIVYEIYSDHTPVLNHESVGFKKFTKEQLKKRIKSHPHEFGNALVEGLRSFYPDLFEV